MAKNKRLAARGSISRTLQEERVLNLNMVDYILYFFINKL